MLTDGRTDGRKDGRKVITIAHPEQSSGELKTSASSLRNYNQEIPFTDEECLTVVKQLFEDNIDTRRVHNKYLCQQYFCSDISDTEKKRLLPKKCSHSKLNSYWWLCFLKGEGMYCIVCKKFNVKYMLNKRDIFVNTPGTRYIKDALHHLVYTNQLYRHNLFKRCQFFTKMCVKKTWLKFHYMRRFSGPHTS